VASVLDIATLGGLIGGAILVLVGIKLGGGSPLQFLSPSALFIVLGGATMATMVAFPMDQVMGSLGLALRTLRRESRDPSPLVAMLVQVTQKARREGLLALEGDLDDIPSEFLRRGLQLVVDGSDPQVLREVMENDIRAMQDRHAVGRRFMEFLGRACPAFGLVGTLIGLIMMLYDLDPDTLGSHMAVALIATFYGVLLANLVFLPMANKLALRSEEETLMRYMMLEGLVSIQSGENPSVLGERLRVFLPPRERTETEIGEADVSPRRRTAWLRR